MYENYNFSSQTFFFVGQFSHSIVAQLNYKSPPHFIYRSCNQSIENVKKSKKINLLQISLKQKLHQNLIMISEALNTIQCIFQKDLCQKMAQNYMRRFVFQTLRKKTKSYLFRILTHFLCRAVYTATVLVYEPVDGTHLKGFF